MIRRRFSSMRTRMIVSVLIILAVSFVALNLQITSVSNSFVDDFEGEVIRIAEGGFTNSEFEINIPVPIISIEGERDAVVVRYFALGGLIGGERIIDLSRWMDRFESITVKGFFLPGSYGVAVFVSDVDNSLRIELFPA